MSIFGFPELLKFKRHSIYGGCDDASVALENALSSTDLSIVWWGTFFYITLKIKTMEFTVSCKI